MLSRTKKAMLTTLAALITTWQSLAARQSSDGFHFTASRHRSTNSTREWMPSLR